MKNVLIIKLRYIGDVLLATPTIRAIKAARPDVRVTMMVNRGTEEVLSGNQDLDEITVLDKGSLTAQWRLIVELRRRRFDTVIDLTDGDRSAFLSWISGAPVRIGFNDEHRWRGRCYTQVVQPMPGVRHRIDRDVASLEPLGLHASQEPPRLWLTGEDEARADQLLGRLGVRRDQPIVILQPAARYWFKAWPYERFAELADRLVSDYGCQVLIGGSREDEALAQRIQAAAKSRPISMAGQATLKEFAAIAQRAALFVGNDSGAMHIAAAVGTPMVALFGPSNPDEWGPRGGPAEVIYKGLDCRACFHPTCMREEENCMKQIDLGEVLARIQRLIPLGRRSGASESACR
ncbi:MAG: putative lipopolysaccharide heptosyltransferase III [Nitrospira sp.]|nr:putative lipopolysaccharide heptosyltransferase III [Nitrospira sp.]